METSSYMLSFYQLKLHSNLGNGRMILSSKLLVQTKNKEKANNTKIRKSTNKKTVVICEVNCINSIYFNTDARIGFFIVVSWKFFLSSKWVESTEIFCVFSFIFCELPSGLPLSLKI